MIIRFKDGQKIKFKRIGAIWLSDSVIWDGTELDGSMEELRVLKAKVAEWFDKNAPKKFAERFTARLPLWKEVEHLPFKDQVAYGTKKTDRIAEYLLGDEEYSRPIRCCVGYFIDGYCWLYCHAGDGRSINYAVRLCLDENLVFDEKKHRYARLENGLVKPLYYCNDTSKPRSFYQTINGVWYMDLGTESDFAYSINHLRITEFLEEKK